MFNIKFDQKLLRLCLREDLDTVKKYCSTNKIDWSAVDKNGNNILLAVLSKQQEYLDQHTTNFNDRQGKCLINKTSNDEAVRNLDYMRDHTQYRFLMNYLISCVKEVNPDILLHVNNNHDSAVDIAAKNKNIHVCGFLLSGRPCYTKKYVDDYLNNITSLDSRKKEHQANKKINQLIGYDVHQTREKYNYTYLMHLEDMKIIHSGKSSLKNPKISMHRDNTMKREFNVEGFFPDKYLIINIYHLILQVVSFAKEIKNKEQYDKCQRELNCDPNDVLIQLKQEILIGLNALRFIKDRIIASDLDNKSIYTIQAKNAVIYTRFLIDKKEQNFAEDNISHVITTGYDRHAIYVNFLPDSNQNIMVRIDNLGIGYNRTYSNTQEKYHQTNGDRVSSRIHAEIPLKNFNTKNDILVNYIINLIKARKNTKDQGLNYIYENDSKSSNDQLRIQYPAKVSYTKYDYPAQTVGNCVVENYSLGMRIRLNEKVFLWLNNVFIKMAAGDSSRPANMFVGDKMHSKNETFVYSNAPKNGDDQLSDAALDSSANDPLCENKKQLLEISDKKDDKRCCIVM